MHELHGMVFIYHAHSAEDRSKPPLYELPALDEIGSGRMVYRGRHDYGMTRMHLLEFAENGPDAAHFVPLHSRMTIPWTQVRIPGIEIDHQAEWMTDPDHKHMAHFHNVATLKFLGKMLPRTRATAKVTFVGPGALGLLRFNLPDVGEILLLEMHTPTAPMRVRIELRWFAEPRVPRPLVSYVVGNWASQLVGDVRIWERKRTSPSRWSSRTTGPCTGSGSGTGSSTSHPRRAEGPSHHESTDHHRAQPEVRPSRRGQREGRGVQRLPRRLRRRPEVELREDGQRLLRPRDRLLRVRLGPDLPLRAPLQGRDLRGVARPPRASSSPRASASARG